MLLCYCGKQQQRKPAQTGGAISAGHVARQHQSDGLTFVERCLFAEKIPASLTYIRRLDSPQAVSLGNSPPNSAAPLQEFQEKHVKGAVKVSDFF